MVVYVSVLQFSKPSTTRHLQQPLQIGGELEIVHTLENVEVSGVEHEQTSPQVRVLIW